MKSLNPALLNSSIGPAYIDLPGDILRARVPAANIEYGPTVPLPPPITLPTEAGNNSINYANL